MKYICINNLLYSSIIIIQIIFLLTDAKIKEYPSFVLCKNIIDGKY